MLLFPRAVEVCVYIFLVAKLRRAENPAGWREGTDGDGESRRRSDIREEGECRIMEGTLQFSPKKCHPACTEPCRQFTSLIGQDRRELAEESHWLFILAAVVKCKDDALWQAKAPLLRYRFHLIVMFAYHIQFKYEGSHVSGLIELLVEQHLNLLDWCRL